MSTRPMSIELTADELREQIPSAPFNHVAAAVNGLLSRQPPRVEVRIAPWSVRGRRGKRARRQAFYSRRKLARFLCRLLRATAADVAAFDQAWVDACSLPYGMAWIEVSDAGTQRIDPATVFYDSDGQEAPPPDGSERDAHIGSVFHRRWVTREEFQAMFGEDDAPPAFERP